MSEVKFCGRCGAKLIYIHGTHVCRNCGTLPENQDIEERPSDVVSYVG